MIDSRSHAFVVRVFGNGDARRCKEPLPSESASLGLATGVAVYMRISPSADARVTTRAYISQTWIELFAIQLGLPDAERLWPMFHSTDGLLRNLVDYMQPFLWSQPHADCVGAGSDVGCDGRAAPAREAKVCHASLNDGVAAGLPSVAVEWRLA